MAVALPPPPSASSFADALAALAAASVAEGGGGAAAGTALYGGASLANHDCAPTAAPVAKAVDCATLTIVATRDLAPGEPVTLCYTADEAAGVETRRAALEEGYGFVCRCGRCVEEAGE